MALSPASLFASGAAPIVAPPAQSAMPMAPAPGQATPSLDAVNSAALLALQGSGPELPPNYRVETQADGSLLLMEQSPDGSEVAVKIISPPKRFGSRAQRPS